MTMVGVDCSSLPADSQAKSVSLRVGDHLVFSVYLSSKPGALSQWPRHDHCTTNIVIGIGIIRPHRSISSSSLLLQTE